MRPVFADACYWIALLHEQDALHDLASLLHDEIHDRPVVTSEMVMVEMLNFFAEFGTLKCQAAVNLLLELRANLDIEIVALRTQQFWHAVDYYNARPDQQWGLVDCASFQIMEERGISEALTNDRHFAQAGFTILM